MRFILIFIIILVFALIAFTVFSYMEQTFLGIILAGVMVTWPLIFWLISKIFENREPEPKEVKKIKQDIVKSEKEEIKEISKEKPTESEEEFVVPPKKYENIEKAKEELKKLKKASKILDDEKKEGILSEDIYNELKNKNKEAIERLEQEIAKAGGEIREKKVYCEKGKHYIAVSKCFPSKVKGYVICPEHNEEIRAE